MIARFLLALVVLFAAAAVAIPGASAQSAAFRSDRIVVEVRGRGADVILIPGLASTTMRSERKAAL